MQVGNLVWAAHEVNDGNGRSAIRWYKYELNDGTTTFLQSGTISVANLDVYLSAINANDRGDVVVHYNSSGAGTGEYISAHAAVGRTTNGNTVFEEEDRIALASGTMLLNNTSWGDYAAVSRDPADNQIFWINSILPSTSTEVWRTRITELIVPAPLGEARWREAAGGNFLTESNWISDDVPDPSDHVVISRPTTPGEEGYGINMALAGTRDQDRLSVRQGALTLDLRQGTLNLTNTGTLTPSLTVAEYGGTPTITFYNGTLTTEHTSIAAGALFTAATSRANVTMLGTNWTNEGSVFVAGSASAAGGHATLTLDTSAVTSIGGNLKVWNNGTVNYHYGATGSLYSGLSITGTLDTSTGGRFLEDTNGQRLLKSGNIVTNVGTISVGTVDLNDNDAMVTATNGGTTAYNALVAQIAYARNDNAWDRPGITSSAARNRALSVRATSLGTVNGTDYKTDDANRTFDGATVANSDLLVKYTWLGDSDLGGEVDFDDYVRIDAGFNTGASRWFLGDFDYSGLVDFDDYVLIDFGFNVQDGLLSGGPDGGGNDRLVILGQLWHFQLRGYMEYFIEAMRRYGYSYTERDFYPSGGRPLLIDVPEPGTVLLACAFAAARLMLSRRRCPRGGA